MLTWIGNVKKILADKAGVPKMAEKKDDKGIRTLGV